MKPEPGDRVKVVTEDEELEGILMPRPEILGEEITVMKLDNGYNIGIENKKIKSITKLKDAEPIKDSKRKISHNAKLPTVSILSFGGTISSKVDYKTGGTYADYAAEDFVEMMPELEKVANLKARKVEAIMSEDMSPEDWSLISKEVVKELNQKDIDGVVVTQGTDTLHFSTAALSFFLKNKNKPVVFTASQRSIDRGSSDAFMNLFCAVVAATSDIAEVMTCMHGTTNDDYCLLIRGTKVRKMHTSRRDAFRAIDEMPLAKVHSSGKLELINKNHNKKNDNEVEDDSGFENKVALVHVYPGIDPDIITYYVDKGYKGIVIAATALGHVPTEREKYSLLPNLKKAIEKNISIVITTQAIYGKVHPYVYTNLRKLSIDLQAIFVEDMLPETAYVKLGWALSKKKKPEDIKELMQTNVANEINVREAQSSFLN